VLPHRIDAALLDDGSDEVNEDYIVLKNTDGEKDMTFALTCEEAYICCFECPAE